MLLIRDPKLAASVTVVTALLAAGVPAYAAIGAAEDVPGGFLSGVQARDADVLPRMLTDATDVRFCFTGDPCELGTFSPADDVTVGIVPAFTGSVDVWVRPYAAGHPAGEKAISCTVPGDCEVLASTANIKAAFVVEGRPSEGAAGGYVLWMMSG